jgi:hypothetical protein
MLTFAEILRCAQDDGCQRGIGRGSTNTGKTEGDRTTRRFAVQCDFLILAGGRQGNFDRTSWASLWKDAGGFSHEVHDGKKGMMSRLASLGGIAADDLPRLLGFGGVHLLLFLRCSVFRSQGSETRMAAGENRGASAAE